MIVVVAWNGGSCGGISSKGDLHLKILPALAAVASYNHGQKSRDKVALLDTHQTQIQLHLPNLAPNPPYNVENYYLQFLLIFNIVLDGEGEEQRVFKRKAALFSNFSSKTQIVH